MKFQKKPVQVYAWPVGSILRSAQVEWTTLPEPVAAAYETGKILFLPKKLEVQTLEGRMTANEGDWLIQGVNGELYPCKPDIFEKTYSAVPCESDGVCRSNGSTSNPRKGAVTMCPPCPTCGKGMACVCGLPLPEVDFPGLEERNRRSTPVLSRVY